ncbi:hypothetical protein QLX08_002890 [Tetragonisca angustula]|uniref:Uncharacterized protein n=1 Tax=Tetragonisca angustula TaxID=166442 RepID=A0AAW1AB74_9HYME
MSPTVASILTLSLLLALPLPAAEAGEITDLFALIRNTLKYWRRVYQMYEEEVTLGYCWAEYLLRRERDARNASQLVDPTNLESVAPIDENDSFEREQWIFAVQGHGARAKRSYPTRCHKYDAKVWTRPSDAKLNSRSNEIRTKLKRSLSFSFQSAGNRHGSDYANARGLSKSMVDFRRNSNSIEAKEGQVGERFLRNLARRGRRSSGIPSPTDIGEISKIAPDALASSTRATASNKTKFKLNELCSWQGSRTAVDETGDAFPKDTRLASKRLVETPGLGSSNAKLSNSWQGIPGVVREVKVSSSGQRIGGSRSMSCRQTVWPPIVADVERLSSSLERFVNARRKLLSRNSRSIKHEPVVEGVSKFSSHVLPKSPLSTANRGRNSTKQSSLFVGSQRFVVDRGSGSTAIEARELATTHQILFHFQRVLGAFLTTLGFFVNVGRQLMDYVDSNSALACTKDYVLGKAVHWIDS